MLVITGCSRGLGKALAQRDYPKIALYRKDVDWAQEHSVTEYFKGAIFPSEPIHVLHLAAMSISGFIHKQNWLEVVHTIETNLFGSWNLLRGFQGVCKERMGSTITLVSSVVTQRPVGGTAAYSMSKGGVESLAKVAALEFARIGTRVNCLQLGYFDQGMIEQVPEAMKADLISEIPLRRFGNVEDLWEAWQFLIKCKYVNGAVIPINGGLK